MARPCIKSKGDSMRFVLTMLAIYVAIAISAIFNLHIRWQA